MLKIQNYTWSEWQTFAELPKELQWYREQAKEQVQWFGAVGQECPVHLRMRWIQVRDAILDLQYGTGSEAFKANFLKVKYALEAFWFYRKEFQRLPIAP